VDDFGIEGKIDLAGQDNDGIRIIDWKLGAMPGAEDSLQLLIYALWRKRSLPSRPT
jgi:hypothetical protein